MFKLVVIFRLIRREFQNTVLIKQDWVWEKSYVLRSLLKLSEFYPDDFDSDKRHDVGPDGITTLVKLMVQGK